MCREEDHILLVLINMRIFWGMKSYYWGLGKGLWNQTLKDTCILKGAVSRVHFDNLTLGKEDD